MMKDLRACFEQTNYGFTGGYTQLIDSMGVTVIDEESDDDYQGDTFALVQEGDRYGWLVYGWGSCTGCDAFQGAFTWNDLEELREALYQQILWADTKAGAIERGRQAVNAVRWYAESPTYRALLQRLT